MQPIQNSLHYPSSSEYDYVMNKYPFHDSGIVDEGLSDETGSVEEDGNNQENVSEDNNSLKKPSQSYLEIIAEAILQAPNRMMQLYEIYNYFQRKYRYFAEDVNKSWKNSVRHNLSLNDCFVKAGRGTNGKGHYWRIHELAEQEFEQGRFRRRRYRQQMRQLQMQASSSIHQAAYPNAAVYPTTPNPYYMCSPPSSTYYPMYSTPHGTNNESHAMTSTTTGSGCFAASPSYSSYDPYTFPYYSPNYQSMGSFYMNPSDSGHLDV